MKEFPITNAKCVTMHQCGCLIFLSTLSNPTKFSNVASASSHHHLNLPLGIIGESSIKMKEDMNSEVQNHVDYSNKIIAEDTSKADTNEKLFQCQYCSYHTSTSSNFVLHKQSMYA